MIADGILNLFYFMLAPIIDFLPDGEFPIDFDANGVGILQPLARMDYLLPFIAPMQFIVGVMGATFAGLLAYRVGLFIYTKVRG